MHRLDGSRPADRVRKYKRGGKGLFATILRHPQRRFVGMRCDGRLKVWVEDPEGRRAPLPARHDLWDHSPTGFDWGYAGSGPAQLALALCANLVDDAQAVRYHQYFKACVVTAFGPLGWVLRPEDALKVLDMCAMDAARDGVEAVCLTEEGGAH